jgi:hypothetical protein
VYNQHQANAARDLGRSIRNRWDGWHAVRAAGDGSILVTFDAAHRPALRVNATYQDFMVHLTPGIPPAAG